MHEYSIIYGIGSMERAQNIITWFMRMNLRQTVDWDWGLSHEPSGRIKSIDFWVKDPRYLTFLILLDSQNA